MTRKRNKSSANRGAQPPAQWPARVRPWLLAALVALCVARPLLPSEGASWIGDDAPFAMLALVVAGGYFLTALGRRRLARPLDDADIFVGLLVAICIISALRGARLGSPRLAVNMLWEWVDMGLVFFLVRQLVRVGREQRVLVVVMIALAAVLSGIGYYQVLIGLPADRAAYAENPDELLKQMGQWFPPGSPERARFENRLQSTEPLATFALANSLAGVLTAWLIVALGVVYGQIASGQTVQVKQQREPPGARVGSIARTTVLLVVLVSIAGCLVLTKSRSAYVAFAAGVVLLPWFAGAPGRSLVWKLMLGAAAACAVLVVAAAVLGGLDFPVLSEATKSLGYRLQYWQSTWQMIRANPIWGVGPGNFQDYYTEFKLPEASEEIRDPHNFLLEVWATGGSLAAMALLAALATFAWRAWRTPRVASPDDEQAAADDSRAPGFMLGGAAVGLVLALAIGPLVGFSFSEQRLAGALALGALVIAAAWRWIAHGALPPRLPALGAVVLLIHLLAAGGIAYPGVAGTLCILAGLALNESDAASAPRAASANPSGMPWLPALGLVATVVAAVACYLSAAQPVVAFHAAMAKAESDEARDSQQRIAMLKRAAKADPMSAEPWVAIAELELATLAANPKDAQAHREFLLAAERSLLLRPHSAATWRRAGAWYRRLHELNGDLGAAQNAAHCLRRAVELYPNSPALAAECALAALVAGETSDAKRCAEAALELDARTPHADKKLSSDQRAQMERMREALR